MKITEAAGVAQGTFYLYFSSKKEIFEELVRDLNRRVRHAMSEGSDRRARRALEAELLGFQALLPSSRREHPALYRIIRQAEFVSPEMLHYHYERARRRATSTALREAAMERGEVARIDPEVTRVGADGDGRADRHALDPLGRAATRCREQRARRDRADHRLRAGGA